MPDGAPPETLRQAVHRIVAELLRVPEHEKLQYLKQAISQLPPELRDPAETLILQTEAIMSSASGHERWERITVFAFGIMFVGLMIVIALFVKEPTPFQIFVFRVVLALAAAGAAALIPGFLDIESRIVRNRIRAGGALAVFVIVYLINPPKLILGP